MKPSSHPFLIACLRDDRTAARAWLQGNSVDWEGLVRAATDECLLPQLNSRLNELELDSTLPEAIGQLLSTVEDLNRERNDFILNEVQFAVRLLNEAGIEPVLLKGIAYLALGVYPNPAARYLRDADLLVSQAQIETAIDVLARNGFIADHSDQFSQFRHHRPPMRRPGSVFLEIHHSLCLGRHASLLPASQVIANSAPCDLGGARARVPCSEDLFTHLVMHSQIQHPYNERIWPPLRALSDLDLVLRRFREAIDWDLIERRFRASGQYGLLALHLSQLCETLGVAPPFPLRMTAFTRFRWLRRKLLRRLPALRYADPIYMFSTVFTRRLRVLGNIYGKPAGLKHLVRQLFTAGVYRRFATDLVEGRGR